jgi:hypothetical protein
MQETLRAAYLAIDRRVLGVFRIALASVLLGDLAYHAAQATLLYSNRGILPNHRVLFAPQSAVQFSIYLPFSTPAEIKVAFALTAISHLLLLVGFRTRIWQIVSFVCVTSLNSRNLFTEDGGCMTLNLIAAWTMMLPLGDRYSIDAVIREVRREPAPSKAPVVSLAVLGVVMQVACIYFFNTVHKTGVTWRDGSAIHWVLWQDRLNTFVAAWLRRHEPGWLSPVLSWSALAIEGTIPLLVLSPWRRTPLRTLAVILSWSLHAGIALLMTLGPFSYAMMALMLLVLPADTLAFVLSRAQRTALGRVGAWVHARVRSVVVGYVRPVPRGPASPLAEGASFYAGESWAFALLAASMFNGLDVNPWLARFKRDVPAPIEAFRAYPRLTQFWAMFSPDVPTTDGILVIDAVTASGRHVDPFTFRLPDLGPLGREPFVYDVLVSDYLFKVGSFKNDGDRRELDRYLREWHDTWKLPATDRIVSYDGWLITAGSPPPGSTAVRNEKREIVMHGDLR